MTPEILHRYFYYPTISMEFETITFVLSYSCWCGVSEIVYHHFKFTLKIRSDSIIVQKSKQNISFICVCDDGYE